MPEAGAVARGLTTYALLPRASANRVYGAASLDLARAELAFVDRALFGGVLSDVAATRLGGVEYLTFTRPAGPLDDAELRVLSNLSGLHALFEVHDGALVPVTITPRAEHDDDVVTIQRYVGKTNEQLTHLLVNVTLAAAGDAFTRLLDDEPVRLLDPVCGRGTSLNRAVVYGLDAGGIEIDGRDVDAYETFVVTWLQDKRVKHQVERARLRRGRATPARRLTISYGKERKGPRRQLDVVHDDTVNAPDHFKDRWFDVVVGDLPYGVQHENRPAEGRVSRSPDELLQAALPGWRRVLRPAGAMGLAWNLRTLARPRLFELVTEAGFEPCSAVDDASFAHRVDRAITRDVLVARRTGERSELGSPERS